MAQSSVRVRIQFDRSMDGICPEKSWFLVNKATCSTIADLSRQITERYCLHYQQFGTTLSIDDFVVLPQESIEILRDNDLIRICKLAKEDSQFPNPGYVKEVVMKKRNQLHEDEIVNSKKRRTEAVAVSTVIKPKKKKSKEKQRKSDKRIDVHQSTKANTVKIKQKKEKHKHKREKATCLMHSETSGKQGIVNKSEVLDLAANAMKNKSKTKATTKFHDIESRTKKDMLFDNVGIPKCKDQNHEQLTGLDKIDKSICKQRKELTKTVLSQSKYQGMKHLSEKKDKIAAHHLNTVLPLQSAYEKGIPGTAALQEDTVQNPYQMKIFRCVLKAGVENQDVAISTKQVRSSSSHLYFNSDGEDESTTNANVTKISENGKVSLKKKKVKSSGRWAKDMSMNDVYSNTSIVITNGSKVDDISSEKCMGNLAKATTEAVGQHEKDQVNTVNTHSLTETKTATQAEIKKDYSSYPALSRPPQTGDLIAYKVIELSLSYTPEISDFKEASVLSYDHETDLVQLELSDASLQTSKGDGSLNRRFELPDDEEGGEENTKHVSLQDKMVSVPFKDMITPKLIM